MSSLVLQVKKKQAELEAAARAEAARALAAKIAAAKAVAAEAAARKARADEQALKELAVRVYLCELLFCTFMHFYHLLLEPFRSTHFSSTRPRSNGLAKRPPPVPLPPKRLQSVLRLPLVPLPPLLRRERWLPRRRRRSWRCAWPSG